MKETRFKDTEVGLIPEDWESISLGDVGEVRMCKRIMKYQTSTEGEIPFYKIGTFGKQPDSYISSSLYENFKAKYNYPNKGDILLSAAGTIGRTVVFDGRPSYFQDSNIVWIDNDGRLLSNEMLYFIYKHLSWVTESGTIPRIYNSIVKSIKFPIPSAKSEQTRIASALTSIDNLLSSLDKLIAKKKGIKKGTMQQLLTGKKRLKGFTEPWVDKQLWQMTIWDKKFKGVPSYMQQRSIKYPYVLANVFDDMETHGGDVLLLSTGNYVGWTTVEKAGCHLCEGEVVAIPWGGVANVKYANGKFVTADNRIATSSDLSVLSNKFLYYVMLFRSEEINSFYRGASIKHPSMLDVLTMRFDIPSIAEQTAIAAVLTAMDNEIAALEIKREKYESMKQGMMQQLLTGRIRLVETAAKTNTITANVHFRRSVLAAEIADRLCEEPTFGHVKMEKMLFLTERLCHIDIGSHYHRDAAGPYDNNSLRSIDSQLKKQKWFEVQQIEKGYKYVAMQNRGKHKTYFDKYYSNVLPMFDKIINTFKTQRTEQCEIVATLYSAWEDLIHKNQPFTDADIVNEVLNWHESKKRISRERWHESIQWMRNNGFAPNNISR